MSYLKAPHSYFIVKNAAEQKRLFLDGVIDQPTFSYRKSYNNDFVLQHLEDSEKTLQLVLASIDLQEPHPDETLQQRFRDLNEKFYGAPSEAIALQLIHIIGTHVTDETANLWQETIGMTGITKLQSFNDAPAHATFLLYKKYFESYTDSLFTGAKPNDLRMLFERALRQTGLEKDGWLVKMADDTSHARVNKAKKLVMIGSFYQPRTKLSYNGIVAHEIYGHALRNQIDDQFESEGFAIVLEQLLRDEFKFRRSYRYLAAALGWGILGGPRTFREVHDIIWRLMVVASGYTQEKAKDYAFNECVRVFRGGRPDIAGMVFLKDTIYLTANIAVWKQLEKTQVSYNEFIDIIEGRRRVLV